MLLSYDPDILRIVIKVIIKDYTNTYYIPFSKNKQIIFN